MIYDLGCGLARYYVFGIVYVVTLTQYSHCFARINCADEKTFPKRLEIRLATQPRRHNDKNPSFAHAAQYGAFTTACKPYSGVATIKLARYRRAH